MNITPATPGTVARFREGDGHESTTPVLAWDDEGRALILDGDGYLIHVEGVKNLVAVHAAPAPSTIVAAVDGEGRADGYDVVAYRIDANGHGIALVADGPRIRPYNEP